MYLLVASRGALASLSDLATVAFNAINVYNRSVSIIIAAATLINGREIAPKEARRASGICNLPANVVSNTSSDGG